MSNLGWRNEAFPGSCINIVVTANQDGRLEIFTYENGGANRMFHKWQEYKPGSGQWSIWVNFDPVLNQYTYNNNVLEGNTDLLAGLTAPGNGVGNSCLEVITMGDWADAQTSMNNGWGRWGRIHEDNMPNSLLLTALARWSDGELYAFGVDQVSLDVLLSYQKAPGARASWNDWQNFSHPANEAFYGVRADDWPFRSAFPLRPNQTSAVGANRDGRIEIFGASTSQMWHRWQTDINSQTNWSDWASLGAPQPGIDNLADWVVIQNDDGRLEVFAAGRDSQFWHTWQTQELGWIGTWDLLPGLNVSYWQQQDPTAPLKGTFRAARDADGCIQFFAIGTDGGVYVQKQLQANDGWADGWEALGGENITAFDVGQNKDGTLEVFIVSEGSVWHRWQNEPGRDGTWSTD